MSYLSHILTPTLATVGAGILAGIAAGVAAAVAAYVVEMYLTRRFNRHRRHKHGFID